MNHSRVEALLLEAAAGAGLNELFVHILELGNFAVTHRVSGFLSEPKFLISARSKLYASVLDVIHSNKVEIMSPSSMNQRRLSDDHKAMPSEVAAPSSDEPRRAVEDIAFDKADLAEQLEGRRERLIAEIKALFSSDAPFRVPIPSEEDVRSMRQLPIEIDPPDHTAYRKIVEPFFARAKDPEMMARVKTPIETRLADAMARDSIEIAREFAIPIQSHALSFLREDPKRVVHAAEEFFRAFTPLTHIGRVCPVDTDVQGFTVKPGGRVSLGWSSANNDETVFDAPEEVRLDRKPNPHVAFGFGTHLCLGAAHARLIVRALLQALIESGASITTLSAEERVEKEAQYKRALGYESLTVKLERP